MMNREKAKNRKSSGTTPSTNSILPTQESAINPAMNLFSLKDGELTEKIAQEVSQYAMADEKSKKKMIQMIRNRISAQNSRDRKKAYIATLERENADLREEKAKLLDRIAQFEKERAPTVREEKAAPQAALPTPVVSGGSYMGVLAAVSMFLLLACIIGSNQANRGGIIRREGVLPSGIDQIAASPEMTSEGETQSQTNEEENASILERAEPISVIKNKFHTYVNEVNKNDRQCSHHSCSAMMYPPSLVKQCQ
jgi:hypothetical protein